MIAPINTKVEPTDIEGVIMYTRQDVFEDHRGVYRELWNDRDYGGYGFHADDISISRRGVLRGIHGDHMTRKLVSCLYGALYLVVVDNRENSFTFMKWTAMTLSDSNHLQVFIPPGCGNGHLVLTDIAIFHYMQSGRYDRGHQFTLAWNDPAIGIDWPLQDARPILSRRDKEAEWLKR